MMVQGRAMSIMGSGINLYYQRDCGAENRNPQIKSTSSSTSVSTKGWTWWNGERAQTSPPPTKKNNENQLVLLGLCMCVYVCAWSSERGSRHRIHAAACCHITANNLYVCACRGDNHMGLSHVLFTAVNGSRNWGPLAFTLRPLGDGGGVGCVSPCEWEGEKSASCIEYN